MRVGADKRGSEVGVLRLESKRWVQALWLGSERLCMQHLDDLNSTGCVPSTPSLEGRFWNRGGAVAGVS